MLTGRAHDFLDKIPKDEPVFIIRAKDKAGPAALKTYAEAAARLGADPELVESVRRQSQAMLRYQLERGGKVPDLEMRQGVAA